jgi:unsaturated rhamnogalacturonyl hydrolase
MKTFLLSCIFLFFSISSFSQASNTWSVKFSNAIMSRWTTANVSGKVCIDKMTSKGWEYSNSIVLHGMEKVFNQVNTPAYLTYIQTYVDNFVNGSGAFISATTLNSLDKIHPGILCLFLWEQTGLLKYKTLATTLKNVLVGPGLTYGKTSNGIFWHKDNGTTYDNVVMLDGMYMAHPFLAKYGSLFGDAAAIDTAVNQTLFTYNQLYDPATKLVRHAWTSTPAAYAWDGAGGNSNAVWSRAMGWYMMALVDILKYVPAGYPKRAQLLTALTNLAAGIKTYQDPTSKLWFQVVDETSASLPGNYLETSGSAMFVYSLKTAVDNGWISSITYLPVAQNGWTGLQTTIDAAGDGLPRINNFAPAMSVLATKAAYAAVASADCPSATHPHGYAAILMAASVMEFPLVILPVKFISFSAKEYADNIRLSWKYGDENGVAHYEIQRSSDGRNFIAAGTAQPTGSQDYSWVDNNVAGGAVYYRVKAISFDGSFYYSPVLFLKQNNSLLTVQVSPNPVTDGAVNIGLNNLKPGKYSIKIINSAGNTIQTKRFDINDEKNVIQTILLLPNSSKGLYYVQLEGNGLKINKTVLIQ